MSDIDIKMSKPIDLINSIIFFLLILDIFKIYSITKGQTILKANYGFLNSPQNQTKLILEQNSKQGVGAVGELLIKSVFVATSWDGFS